MTPPHRATRTLPERPSAEHLRKQAKRLAKEAGLKLAEAQRRLANEYGSATWADLLQRVLAARALGPLQHGTLSPLAHAARAGELGVVLRLLTEGEPPNGSADDAASPLWCACASDADASTRIQIVGALLRAGANPRDDRAGETALHAAAARGPLSLVELLIHGGALEWQTDHAGRTPLDAARSGSAGDRDAIAELLDRPVIRDASFRAAVAAIQRGDAKALARLLDAEPRLLRERIVEPQCYRDAQRHQYFRDPKLFWFVANNPTLMERMPAGIVDVARTMIQRGVDRADLDYTLELVMTSATAREQGFQLPLVDTLLAAGATPTPRAIEMTLAHWEVGIVEALLARGHPLTAPIAAALGRTAELPTLLRAAPPAEVQQAFGLAVLNRQPEAARLALDAGADPNGFLPVHSHSTPLHQAAADDHLPLLELLLERGARTDVADALWNATPLGWAEHHGNQLAAAALRAWTSGPLREKPA
jgi:peptide-methionine (S)-S-oxide reductase